MKKKLRTIILIILTMACCLPIASCGALQSKKLSNAENDLVSYNRTISAFHTANIEPEQTENDYEIEWNDPGMEAWMRLLLHKDGAILHSDVCNIQVLYLVYGGSTPYGILFDELPAEADAFTSENSIDDPNNYIYAENKIKLGIHSLEDLRHFDHLQVFGYINSTGNLDLSMFEKMPNLSVLSLYDIEPLTQELRIDQQQLQYLKLSCLGSFPSLKALDESAVKYLDLSVDRSDQALCDNSAFESLTKMKDLEYLNVLGQKDFDSNIWHFGDGVRVSSDTVQ